MKTYSVIIPAHNEANFLEGTLQSLCEQTVSALEIILVNDNATDDTETIMQRFSAAHANISYVNHESEAAHLPGAKVIHAFAFGLKHLEQPYDVLVKLDADLLLPENYFETILAHFKSDSKIGMAGGFAYIEKNGEWILENLTDKDHIRGAFKAYRKECFLEIGNLKPAMGWDTVDELLCKFYGWEVVTDSSLKVKHLKPTGANYNKTARFKQGEAFYSIGYGFFITAIASLKLAFLKGKPLLFFDYIQGFWKAKLNHKPLLVTDEQAKFIRNYRWKKMKGKIFNI